MDWTEAVLGTGQGVELDVYVSPGASRSEIGSYDQWRKRLTVKVKAPPEDGKANRELERLLGEFFNCKAEVVRGHTVRAKTVLLACDLPMVMRMLEGRM